VRVHGEYNYHLSSALVECGMEQDTTAESNSNHIANYNHNPISQLCSAIYPMHSTF